MQENENATAAASSTTKLSSTQPAEKTAQSNGSKAKLLPPPIPDNINLSDPQWFLNRELTWIEFNRRVFHEAQDIRTPLLERVWYMSILGSNFDEFFMKRIGGLKQQVGAGYKERSVDGRLPQQQIDECYVELRDIFQQMQVLEAELFDLLVEQDIHILEYTDLDSQQQQEMDNYFMENIYPLLTPQGMDPAHPFPFISNLSLNLLVATHHHEDDHIFLNRIKIPLGVGIPRFIPVQTEDNGESNIYVLFEDLINNNLETIFPGMIIENCGLFRVTRNAITEKNQEQANDLLSTIESALRDRKFAEIVRLEVNKDMPELYKGMLAAELGIDERKDVFKFEGIMGKADLREIAGIDKPELHFPPHQPLEHARLSSDAPNIFHLIREEGPFLLQHPYESFSSSVERFLKEASRDPKVLGIKMTLYRTSSDSRIIQYLLDAAQNGKQVAVVVELQARFDESANIHWANYLEKAGVHVTYGVVGLKTHSKVIFVVRREYNGIRRYAHIGTGNYHAGTARAYSDLGVITCSSVIGDDLTELFNYLTMGYAPDRNYQRIVPSPRKLKKMLLSGIAREIKQHSKDKPGLIQFKTNALTDRNIIEALYKASQAGVKVQLIIRDSCRLRPGIRGISENISVISIVGRFLEHARIYYFQNGGEEEYYIGSADLMRRNLERRVEVVTPISTPHLQEKVRDIIDLQLEDNRNAWDMLDDGTSIQRKPAREEETRSCQLQSIANTMSRLKEAQRLLKQRTKKIPKRKKN